MFTSILTAVISLVMASDCNESQKSSEVKEEQIITTDIPKHLKDAVIIVRQKDGRESHVSANLFKVVPRKQQRVVTKVVERTERVCKVASKEKNLLMLGGRRDHTDLDIAVNGNSATVKSQKGMVFDATYYRQNIGNTPVGAGAGVDTNGTLRGVVGVEF